MLITLITHSICESYMTHSMCLSFYVNHSICESYMTHSNYPFYESHSMYSNPCHFMLRYHVTYAITLSHTHPSHTHPSHTHPSHTHPSHTHPSHTYIPHTHTPLTHPPLIPLATSGINGALTRTQIKQEIKDSVDAFYADTAKSARDLLRPELAKVLVGNSASAVEWLQEKFKLDLSLVGRLGMCHER